MLELSSEPDSGAAEVFPIFSAPVTLAFRSIGLTKVAVLDDIVDGLEKVLVDAASLDPVQ